MVLIISITQLNVVSALAENRSYIISKQHIDITIDKSGAAYISEYLTYDFQGVFNGVLMDIDYAGFGILEDMKIFIEENNTLISVEQNRSQAPHTFEVNDSNSIAQYKVYEPSVDCVKTFVYKYTLTDAVTVFNDIAQFNRKIIAPNRSVITKNITANINLPPGAAYEDIKIFVHGPLTGESKIESPTLVSLSLTELQPNTFIETNLLFPKELVAISRNIVNENALDRILAAEAADANEANAERDRAKEKLQLLELEREYLRRVNLLKRIGLIVSIFLSALWIFIMILIYYKFDKEFKVQFSAKYFRDLPGNYAPAIMSALINFNKLHPRDLMATIMDLVRRKQLSIDLISYKEKKLLGSRDKEDYKISVTEFYNKAKIDEHEVFLINWFIKKIGDGKSVTLEKIKGYSKNSKNGIKFKEDYDKWCALTESCASKHNFFDPRASKGQVIGILFNIAIIVSALCIMFFLKTYVSVVLIVLGFIGVLFSANIHRRSNYGQEQLEKWMAFKRFLKDFSQMDKAVVGSIVIWEHFLVYAISLGIAKEVISKLPLVFSEDEFSGKSLTLFNMYHYGASGNSFTKFDQMFSSTMNVMQRAVSASQEAALSSIANSTYSSATGSGGGFSGGSSGGGGGGGGSGAF